MASAGYLDGRLQALLARWDYARSPAEVVALGDAALVRLLDAVGGRSLHEPGSDPREYENAKHAAIGAFAARDLDAVVGKMRRRGWSDERIACSGVAEVADARIVSMLVALAADKSLMARLAAVGWLARQRDPLATEALVRALSDRSSDVRSGALRSLVEAPDANAIAPLQEYAKRAREPWLAKDAKAAIAKIRKSLRKP